MIFETEEAGIFHLLMGFLKEKRLFETLSSLQLEIGQADEPLEENLLYLQRLILQGRLDDVILYIEPLEKVLQNKFQELLYVIHRQQFLEALCWHGGGGHRHAFLPWKPSKSADIDGEFEIDVIVKLLKSLEFHCSAEEFNSLCSCLTLPKLSDNPDYSNWSVAEGRLETFQIIKNVINPYIHLNTLNSNRNGSYNDTQFERKTGGFLSMLAMGLTYQVQNSNNTNNNGSIATFNGNILSVKGFNESLPGNEKNPFIEIKNPIEINSQFYDAKIYKTIIETKGEIDCNRNSHINPNDQNTDQYPSSDQGPLSVGRSRSDGQSDHDGGSLSRMRYGSNNGPGFDQGHGSDRNARHNDQTNLHDNIPQTNVIAINTKDTSPRMNEDDSSIKASPKISPVAWTINNEDKNNMRKSTQKLERNEGNHNERRGDSNHRENHSNRNEDSRFNNRNNHNTNGENNINNSDKNYHNNDSNRDIHGNFDRNFSDHNYNNNRNGTHNNSNDYKNHDDKHYNSDDINNGNDTSSNTSNGKPNIHIDNSRYDKNSINYNNHNDRNDNDSDKNYSNINANKRIHDSKNDNNDNHDTNGNSNCNNNGSNSNLYANNDHNNAIMNRYSNTNTNNMNRDDIQSSSYNPESNKEGYKKELSPNMIFQTDCPVRCVRLLSNDNENKQNKNDNDMNNRNGYSSTLKCAIGCNDKSLKILDISGYLDTRISGEVVKEYGDVHRGSIYAMDHYSSAKGVNLITTVSNDKAVKILNLNNGLMSAPMKGHTGTIRDVSFRKGSDDLLLLATAGAGDNKGRIWDASTGSSYAVLNAHTDSIHGLAWLGDQDTTGLILTGDEKGLIIAHDLRSSRPAWMLNLSDNPGLSNSGGNSVCCMESVSSMLGGGQGQGHGNDVVVGCTGGYVSIIDPIQRTINHIHKAHNDDVRNISIYDSKKFNHNLNSNYFFNLVTTSFDNICSIWEIDRNNMSYNMKLNYMLKGHTDKVLGVSTRLDNGVLDVITTGADGKVILWK